MITRAFNKIKFTLLGLICILLVSCNKINVNDRMLILTEIPGNLKSDNITRTESGFYPAGARISAIIPGKSGPQIIFTESFYSACFPDISFDGRSMIFSAQMKENDPWQIWEMDLSNLKFRKVTAFRENCTDPAWLPDGRLVFSKLTVNDTVKSAYCLFTCKRDGSDLRQITFSPVDYLGTKVLKDGRLLTIATRLLPGAGHPVVMVMRPDGTKADLFYKSPSGSQLTGGPEETNDGKVLLIENPGKSFLSGELISVSYNRPLHSRINLTSDIGEEVRSAYPVTPTRYLVTCRSSAEGRFTLHEFDPEKRIIGNEIFSDPEYSIHEVFVPAPREKPKKLPSEVDMGVKTGLLLCQDINFLNQAITRTSGNLVKADLIEVTGIDSIFGVVEAEVDGSIYLKVLADTPFRIRTLDKKGNEIAGPCSWLWLRPNERRGCVGCHEDPELAPENKVSLAVRKSPALIPVNVTEVKEKTVDLE